MAQRFYSDLDLDTFDKFNKELVGDAAESKDGIIFQQVDQHFLEIQKAYQLMKQTRLHLIY